MSHLISAVILIAVITAACRRPLSSVTNKFADSVFVKIHDFQDRRLSDSLYPYFTRVDAMYRKGAVLAFASIQDSTAVDRIGELLLNDGTFEVRKAAAFALGQTPCRQSESLLLNASRIEKNRIVLREILESYGKVTKNWKLEISPIDSLARHGLAWSFYRSGLNGIGDSLLNAMASELLNPPSTESTRLGSAHYFARGATAFEQIQYAIISSAQHDHSVDVRMASTLALRKIKSDSARIAAQHILQSDTAYRVRINAIRALQSFPLEQTKEFLIKALHDENVNVSIAASEVIKAATTKNFWKDLVRLARTAKNWRIQSNLYEAALTAYDQKELAEEIRTAYSNATDPYHKASLLMALQQSIMAYEFVQEQLFNSNLPVVIKSAAATSLVAMNYRKNFEPSLKKRFASIYVRAIDAGDPVVIGIIAGALADSALGYKEEIKKNPFLYEAKKKLSLPKDNEAMQPLDAAIAYFEGKKFALPKNEFNHPIDWQLVKSIPREQKAIITTTKGNIIIRLFVEEAPGSVANFVTLVNRNYFNNKSFHRVVPNFVIQGGCNRGDGWGSEDYSLRSEFSERRYKTGSLGMASSGKDTEGTQWFITHSPTPHLDGRYTIFAEVTTGMEVVHHIEVGDKILKIDLK